jgi:hypothetical protein
VQVSRAGGGVNDRVEENSARNATTEVAAIARETAGSPIQT